MSEWEEVAEDIADTTLLSPREAEVYVLHHEEGYTLDSTAGKLGISEGNVRGKWAKIKQKIEAANEKKEIAANTAQLL